MFGIPASELALLAVAIVIGGVLTGLLAGLFGVGGGAIIVPVLYEIFRILGVSEDIRIQLCVGTSLAIIIPTSIRSYLAHRARGTLPTGVLKAWIVPITVGVIVGGVIAALAPAPIFKSFFAVMALLLGAKFLFANERWRIAGTLPGRALMTVYGLFIGFYSAMMGVGGGAVSTLILSLYGQPIHAAVGISAGVGVIISVVGTIGFIIAGLSHQALMPPLSIGYVSLIGVALMAPVSAFVAPYGARIAHALSRRKLELAFGIFLWIVAFRFIVSLLP
ncbi:sulfite exporter TauE/SafE family protein [Pseudorhodoplanes sp.]|uniref:sulfite exporter TauE/SafE family protein n=1 Tax=Pseudorhodoplanes sp. TaxID=1934341 RepID=UPI002C9C1AE0|nr:sulfite exporter TauE/SafE family protein [Pseudorhodoplanes sp.]HWV54024.1 sulfite exporter TauE/SafE family protein [Pseudorhodoplanes sp.]